MALYHNIEKACRVCLSVDNKLYSVSEHGLAEKLFELTGIQVLLYDGLPQYLCVFCCERLRKSLGFRNTCKETYQFIVSQLQQGRWPTISELKTFQTTNELHLSVTNLQAINYPNKSVVIKEECIDSNENTEEITLADKTNENTSFENVDYASEDRSVLKEEKADVEVNFDKDIAVSDDSNDSNDNDNLPLKVEKDLKVNRSRRKKQLKVVKKTTTKRLVKGDTVKKFTNTHLDESTGLRRKLYKHILDKYIKKISKEDKGSNPSDNETENDSTETEKRVKDPNRTENQEFLHQYIDNKYRSESPKDWRITRKNKIKKTEANLKPEQKILINKQTIGDFSNRYHVEVVILDREQQIQDVLDRKETDKYKISEFRCQLCYRGFSYAQTFQNHMAIHDANIGQYECYACHARFKQNKRLNTHIAQHKYKFICKQCKHVTRCSTAAQEHYKTHSGHVYPCEHCGKVFTKYSTRINHVRVYHGALKCDICFEGFTNLKGLTLHKIKSHRDIFKCSGCSIQFHNADALKIHRESLTDGECGTHIRPCTQCGINFPNGDILEEHMAVIHNRRSTGDNSYFRGPKGPRIRGPRARGNMSEEKGLTEGQRNKMLMCEVCAMDRFPNESALRSHQRIHTGEKPFSCPHCDKTFRVKESLNVHIRTHTGDRPFQCDLCPRAFKTLSNMYRHKSVHSEDRCHPCEVCNKPFKSVTLAKQHLKAVHMKLPAYCPDRSRKRGPKK